MDLKSLILVFFGGGIGSSIRYLITKYSNKNLISFPIGTSISNLVGCFIIGLLIAYYGKNDIPKKDIFLFVGTLYKDKGLTETIDYFREYLINSKIKNKLIIIGKGPEKDFLIKRVDDFCLSEHVVFVKETLNEQSFLLLILLIQALTVSPLTSISQAPQLPVRHPVGISIPATSAAENQSSPSFTIVVMLFGHIILIFDCFNLTMMKY